jgi:hypothetical protein
MDFREVSFPLRVYSESKLLAKEELIPELENESDEEAQAEIRETIHQAWVTGIIWVQDGDTANSGEVLLAWLDKFGRSVRCTRVEYENVAYGDGMYSLRKYISLD